MRFKQFLIEYDQNSPQREVNIGNRDFKHDYDYDENAVGSGYYSKVTTTKDEHLVRKKSKSTNEDPYWVYIDALIKSGIYQENPHFPRLYNIKKYKNVRNDIMHKADIEKLEPMTGFNIKMLKSYIDQIMEIDDEILKLSSAFDVRNILTGYLHDLVDGDEKTIKITKDETLLEAAKFIHDFTTENNFYNDLHDENFMFRRGNYGIQVVFTDPVCKS